MIIKDIFNFELKEKNENADGNKLNESNNNLLFEEEEDNIEEIENIDYENKIENNNINLIGLLDDNEIFADTFHIYGKHIKKIKKQRLN